MESPTPPATIRFRLTGSVDGAPRTFLLEPGSQKIGSSPESDIYLPVSGVSREHALITVTPRGLSIEDRGSKNGTFLGGVQVERHAMTAGDRLEIGPVTLDVEAVDSEDVDLALVLDAGAGNELSQPLLTPPETAFVTGRRSVDARWLALAGRFADALLGRSSEPRDAALQAALELLCSELGVDGCCALKRSERGDVLVTASSGLVGSIAESSQLASIPGADLLFSSAPGSTSAWLRRGAEQPCWGLLLWGDFPGRAESSELLGLLLRLVEMGQPQPPAGVEPAARARRAELDFPEGFIQGRSPAMTRLYRQLSTLPDLDVPVLFAGETGVGKDQLASILHRSSRRRDRPLVTINCAAIPADLLEAELFGIGRGVATGVDARRGRFQLAEGGSLFLDEIGEMLPSLQTKLLRVLQEKEVQPVGGEPRAIDVRIIAATNADLEDRMARGEFRSDLYYRLAGYVLEVPPLRERREDIPGLVEHFLRVFSQEAGMRVRGMTIKALRRLTAYAWPGNIRELQHDIRRLVHGCEPNGVIDAGSLPAKFGSDGADADADALQDAPSLAIEARCRALEIRLIREALRRTAGLQVKAAELLGISRNGLADKIKRFGIDVAEFRDAE